MAEQRREAAQVGHGRAAQRDPGRGSDQDALGYAEAIIATVREPLVVLEGDLRVRTANRSFYRTFRVRPQETEGQLLYELGNRQWDIPALRRLLGEILPQNTAFDDFAVEQEFPGIGKKVMLLNARKLDREGSHAELILLAIEDVTALREAERRRQEVETRFTEMVKHVRDHSIFLTDRAGVITSWNVAAERIIGYTEAEVVGRHYALIFTPEDVQAGMPAEELRQARETGRAEDERWHVRKDGSRFWALGIVTPLHDPEGRLSGFSKILRDMTAWKRADEAVRERERQLQLVTDTAPVLIAHCGADLRYRFVNQPYARRFNLHPRDVVGRTMPEVLGEAAFARVRPQVEAVLSGRRVEFEEDIPIEGAGTQTMRVACQPELDPSGRVIGFVAALQNVSARRGAEAALRQSEERLRAIIDNSPSAIFVKDAEGRYLLANQACAAFAGQPLERIVGQTDHDYLPGEFADHFRGVDRRVLATGEALRLEELAPFGGEPRHVLTVKFPLRDGTGRPNAVCGIVTDISELRRATQALRASEERFARFMQHLPGLAWIKDAQGRYVYVNDAAVNAFARPRARLYGKTDGEIFPPASAAQFRENDRKALAGGTGVRVVETLEQADGVLHYSVVSKFPIPGPDGAAALVGGIAIDVTEEMRVQEALRDSEAKYRTLFENMAEEVHFWQVVRDEGGRIQTWRLVDANPPTLKTWGKTLAEIQGKTTDEIFGPGATDHYLAVVQKIMAEGVPHAFEDYFPHLDRHFRFTSVPLGDHFITTGADITAVKKAHAALRESEERLRAVLRATPTPIFIAHDRECRTMTGNPAAFQAVKTPEGDVVSASAAGDLSAKRAFREYRDGQPLPPDELPMQIAAREGVEVRGVELSFVFQDGEVRHFYGNAVPLRNDRGDVTGAIAAYVDITGLKQAQERLLQSEGRFRQLAEAMPQLVWVADPAGRIVYLNQHWRKLTGATAEEGMGDGWTHFLHPDDLERVRAAWQSCVRSGQDYEAEYRLRGRDGQYRWQVVRGVPIRDDAGQVARWYGSSTDIDEPKRLAESLREADRRKDEFLATLAHELRNPLAPLRNGLQVMKMAAGNADAVAQARAMMERQMVVMVRLIDDLLDVSRITRGKLELRKERVELASVVQSAVEGSRPLIEASGHRLAVILPPEPVRLDADPTRLAQVFANLLTNAAKYTDAGGQIRLTAERHGGEVVVAVKDTGIGIARDHLPRLFEMFSQVTTALERSQGGLGIGLALVKGLVQMHGGTVAARSDGPGKGSEFIVRLPVPRETPNAPTSEPGGGAEATGRARRRILVADDNRDAADSLALVLRLAGHEVYIVHDGQEAVDAAAWFRPDLALLDIGMPRLNGFDAARRIRAQPWGRLLPLVAITGWGQEEDKRRAREAGFDHHLTKPVDPAALQELLARAARPAPG